MWLNFLLYVIDQKWSVGILDYLSSPQHFSTQKVQEFDFPGLKILFTDFSLHKTQQLFPQEMKETKR